MKDSQHYESCKSILEDSLEKQLGKKDAFFSIVKDYMNQIFVNINNEVSYCVSVGRTNPQVIQTYLDMTSVFSFVLWEHLEEDNNNVDIIGDLKRDLKKGFEKDVKDRDYKYGHFNAFLDGFNKIIRGIDSEINSLMQEGGNNSFILRSNLQALSICCDMFNDYLKEKN